MVYMLRSSTPYRNRGHAYFLLTPYTEESIFLLPGKLQVSDIRELAKYPETKTVIVLLCTHDSLIRANNKTTKAISEMRQSAAVTGNPSILVTRRTNTRGRLQLKPLSALP